MLFRSAVYVISENVTENAEIAKSANKLAESANKLAESANQKSEKSVKYCCKCCNYHTNDLADYNKHLKTKKHIDKSYAADEDDLELELIGSKLHQCKCGKSYKHKESLSRHRKSCTHEEPEPSASDAIAQFNNQFQMIMNVMTTFISAQTAAQTNQSTVMIEQNKALKIGRAHV